jgi:hypothetical protein
MYREFLDKVGWTEYDVSARSRRSAVPDFYTIDVGKMEVAVYEVNDTHRPSPHKYDELHWMLDDHDIRLRYFNIEAETGYTHEIDCEHTSLVACYQQRRVSPQ